MSFTCQAGLLVKDDRKCEHCGATDDDMCGRLPDILQERIDCLLGALEGLLRLEGERDDDDGELNQARVLARAAIKKAKEG